MVLLRTGLVLLLSLLFLLSTLTTATSSVDNVDDAGHDRPGSIRSPSLVFTVLGSTLRYQTYVWISTEQARALNPSVSIILILSRAVYAESREEVDDHAKNLTLTVVIQEDLPSSSLAAEFQKHFFIVSNLVPIDGNPDFVRVTIERVIALYDLAQHHNLVDIFHMENDNMMYVNLKTMTRVMHTCRVGAGIPVLDDISAALSFTYFYNADDIRMLVEFIIEMYKLGRDKLKELVHTDFVTDMSITRQFLKQNNYTVSPRRAMMMPTWNMTSRHQKNCLWRRDNAIYDAAALGQYFGGTHSQPSARWYEGQRPYTELNTKNLTWKSCTWTSPTLLCPWIDERRVVNLHIHSKQLHRFFSKNPLDTLPT